MRILMIGPGRDVIGGITTLVEVLVPALEKRSELFYFPTVSNRPIKDSGRFTGQNILIALAQYGRFLKEFLRVRPQIVHIHTSQGLAWLKDTFYIILGKLLRAKVVLHIHAADFDDLYGKKGRLTQAYTRWAMNLTDAVISVSDKWKDRLGEIVRGEKVFSFPNCIAIDSFSTAMSDHHIEGVRALFIGSVGHRKGTFDLIEALGRMQAAGCELYTCIAGHEEREGELEKARELVKKFQIETTCELPGSVRGAKKAEVFANANLFVLPSYNEGLPMAILEGMSAGMAVVSTPVGGIPEIVHDGYNGFLVQPGDAVALAEKLSLLANDPTLCQLMGKRSREIVEKLDVKPYVGRLIDLYNTL